MSCPIEYVERLARALDEDDYETALSALAERVEYTIGDDVLHGPIAVVASYRKASEMAHRLFDAVGYGHQIVATDDPDFFRVRYRDELVIAGDRLDHRAEQHVTVAPGEGVIGITNIDLPGEAELVDEFLTRHGRSREM
jgi:ketosteroid isomerase-like protein